jgi:Histidine kinase-, DNA gyrase B-, and HSP90-like ATPase
MHSENGYDLSTSFMADTGIQASLFSPTFGDGFLNQHAGSIILDPRFAIVELVANAWDAGADKVEIQWPQTIGEEISISDNGTGMTETEFSRRWLELNYNRVEVQGSNVKFPQGKNLKKRLAFGRNGVGRHAAFCFANEYCIETTKEGIQIQLNDHALKVQGFTKD